MAAEVYIRRVDAGYDCGSHAVDPGAFDDYRVYMPMAYDGNDPVMRQWQVHAFRKNLDHALDGGHASGDVYSYVESYLTHLMPLDTHDFTGGNGEEGDEWMVWDRSDWVETGTWGNVTTGDDDTLTPTQGVNSAETIYSNTQNDHLDITFTVPSGWSSGACLELTLGENSYCHYSNGSLRIQIWKGGDGQALNGCGITRYKNDLEFSPSRHWYRGLRFWDANGVTDFGGEPGAAAWNFDAEIMRNLEAGQTYTIRATKASVSSSDYPKIGRLRLRRQHNECVPGGTNWAEYLPEQQYYNATGEDYYVGFFSLQVNSSTGMVVKEGLSSWTGGPDHGYVDQTGFALSGDGDALTGFANGDVQGPFSTVCMLWSDEHKSTDDSSKMADVAHLYTLSGRACKRKWTTTVAKNANYYLFASMLRPWYEVDGDGTTYRQWPQHGVTMRPFNTSHFQTLAADGVTEELEKIAIANLVNGGGTDGDWEFDGGHNPGGHILRNLLPDYMVLHYENVEGRELRSRGRKFVTRRDYLEWDGGEWDTEYRSWCYQHVRKLYHDAMWGFPCTAGEVFVYSDTRFWAEEDFALPAIVHDEASKAGPPPAAWLEANSAQAHGLATGAIRRRPPVRRG